MGNSVYRVGEQAISAAPIIRFYTKAAWIDGRADDQLTQLAHMPGIQRICAFPDLHPGKHGPVGVAALADRLYPHLIGSDIGCGMSLFALDIPNRKLRVDKAAQRLRVLEHAWDGDGMHALSNAGLPTDLFADALGSIGGGNHFCELQRLDSSDLGLGGDDTFLLVHSGSRALGTQVFAGVVDQFHGLDPKSTAAMRYLHQHDQAVNWARLNRRIIAERAAIALRCDLRLITDVAHNLLRPFGNAWLHRKGAAEVGSLVPLAGSRATRSYLMAPGAADTLGSLSHGAGRKYDRGSMHGRVGRHKSDVEAMGRNGFGGVVVCEDRNLLIEEAPEAYKSAAHVMADLVATGAARQVAAFVPLVTFKKARVAP